MDMDIDSPDHSNPFTVSHSLNSGSIDMETDIDIDALNSISSHSPNSGLRFTLIDKESAVSILSEIRVSISKASSSNLAALLDLMGLTVGMCVGFVT